MCCGHRVGSKLCPLCHELKDHEHVLRHCRFSAFRFDTDRKAFGMVQWEGGNVEPSRLIFEEPSLSLQSSQGLVLRAALKAQWALRCEARLQGVVPSLDDFVARWLGFWRYRAEKDMSLSRTDLQHLVGQLCACFDGGMFQHIPLVPGVFPRRPAGAGSWNLKEQKWGEYRDGVVKRLLVLEQEGRVIVYIDGWAKRVKGWWLAGGPPDLTVPGFGVPIGSAYLSARQTFGHPIGRPKVRPYLRPADSAGRRYGLIRHPPPPPCTITPKC